MFVGSLAACWGVGGSQWLSGDAIRRAEENLQLPNWSIGQLDPVKWLINQNPEQLSVAQSNT